MVTLGADITEQEAVRLCYYYKVKNLNGLCSDTIYCTYASNIKGEHVFFFITTTDSYNVNNSEKAKLLSGHIARS